MADWRQRVQAEFRARRLTLEKEEEIVAELADYLEDFYSDCRRQGDTDARARARALAQVPDWRKLARRIHRARFEEDAVNARTRSFWLPGVVTLVLSESLLMLAARVGPFPRVIPVGPGLSLILYWPWLVLLPVVGALGAYWSRRVGGRLPVRLGASLFPAACLLGFLVLLLPVSFIVDRHVPLALKLSGFVLYIGNWVLLPGAALFLGALPFLRPKLT